MKIQLNSLLEGASCALLPVSAFADISFLSGVALPNGGEIISFAGDSLLSTNSIAFKAATTNPVAAEVPANHSIQAYTLGSNAVLSATSTIDLNTVYGTAGATLSISSVLNDARGFGVATVIPTATGSTNFGRIAIFDKTSGSILKTLDVGYHPDSVTITPDGSKLLIANEGEFVSTTADGTFARPGSVSVVNLSGVNSSNYASTLGALTNAAVSTHDFSAGNLGAGVTLDGLRNNRLDTLTVKTANAADVEPEYITASNTTAYVTLQEANAIATLDLATGKYTKISLLGTITQTIDASDRDGAGSGSTQGKAIAINDTVAGMPMPDTITKFERNGTTYLVTANEGDARGDDGDITRGATLLTNTTATPEVVALANNTGIGRLNLLKDQGDTNADGIIDTPTMLGTRSFSIWNAETGALAFDSASMIEQYVAANNPDSFNMSKGDPGLFDTRSDDKGPEPEALAFGSFDGKDFVFVGNERENGIFQFDITDISDPSKVTIVGYFNPITGLTDGASGGVYISPESMLFLAAGAAGNTTGKNLLIVGFEGHGDPGSAGSIGVFEVTSTSAIPEPSTYAAFAGLGVLGLALSRRRRAGH
ncbi:MAG: PEP-CTERM sorting domain-containing protein [Opitutus sp.]|nr:PEP-CTERM sorting domain-containing protein [Opitutus sp.]MCS6248162.1 PEP-CTERM sorting domain-containing protein [Opitutus sp.]MCS6274759.1 PEP-CTERM sorting domain-containing protein [Opitutus sp.]MCS6276436.1 PEP-CTERM sorting domain-containing protein [Opitutus sp.]MCS6301916.1 PEP-CTERM sorting domain-containing protein [Opitutus sp.]